jgi:hypothetical protein
LTAKNAGEIAVSGTLQEKRVLASKVFGSNLVLDCKKARGYCVKPWSLVPQLCQTGGMVGATGVEPARISPKDPKSFASANSATRPDFQTIFAATGTTVNTFCGTKAWNDEFLRVLENFPAGAKNDEVDALSGAYETIGGRGAPFECESVRIPRPIDSMLSHFDRRIGRGRLLW